MSHIVEVQLACQQPVPFPKKELIKWAQSALASKDKAEITLRLVDKDEIQGLNRDYRQQDKPTNVLAFPSHLPDHISLDYPFLGDVIICPEILFIEAQEQEKALQAHWAHIIIHGVLHLLGYDHINDEDAKLMQAEEIKLLLQFGFANPYHHEEYHLE